MCQLRHEPIDVQVEAARQRLAMVPPDLRLKRVPARLWPAGQRWCASCQSFVDLVDVPKGAGRCKACQSAATHAGMIERTYGLTATAYKVLLELQGGKCAICRNKPKSKRLAVDHDHKSGKVRGLLCSRCNHDLMGAAWDSMAMANALVGYLTAPPATGAWQAPEADTAPRKRADLMGAAELGAKGAPASTSPFEPFGCQREHFLPNGAITEPGKVGVWKVWVSDREDATPPF